MSYPRSGILGGDGHGRWTSKGMNSAFDVLETLVFDVSLWGFPGATNSARVELTKSD